MSVCKKDLGQKRNHKYENGNTCTVCGHVTTHGANFRREETRKAKEEKEKQ